MSADEAIDYFYKIKGKYDTKYNNAKKRIMASNDSTARKRARVQSITLKCVSCKRDVGVRFSVSDRHLRAVCGDSTNPCKLNIDIQLGQYESMNSLDDSVTSDLNTVKVQIIETKLLLLFGLLDEDRMEEIFLDLKKSYKSLVQIQNMIDGEIKNNQMIKIQDAVVRVSEGKKGDQSGIREMRDIERTTLAAANQVKLGNLISDFKRQIREYENDTSADTKLAKITDAIDLYLTQIIPTVNTIRTTLYKINTIIKEKKHYKLVQIKMPLKDRVLEITSPEIISNIK